MKKSLIALLFAASLAMPSCLGPNHAHDSLRNWNAELSEQDWVNEIVFLVMTIIPVYGIAMFVDIVALNTIDYWSGNNPISAPGPFPATFGK